MAKTKRTRQAVATDLTRARAEAGTLRNASQRNHAANAGRNAKDEADVRKRIAALEAEYLEADE